MGQAAGLEARAPRADPTAQHQVYKESKTHSLGRIFQARLCLARGSEQGGPPSKLDAAPKIPGQEEQVRWDRGRE